MKRTKINDDLKRWNYERFKINMNFKLETWMAKDINFNFIKKNTAKHVYSQDCFNCKILLWEVKWILSVNVQVFTCWTEWLQDGIIENVIKLLEQQ